MAVLRTHPFISNWLVAFVAFWCKQIIIIIVTIEGSIFFDISSSVRTKGFRAFTACETVGMIASIENANLTLTKQNENFICAIWARMHKLWIDLWLYLKYRLGTHVALWVDLFIVIVFAVGHSFQLHKLFRWCEYFSTNGAMKALWMPQLLQSFQLNHILFQKPKSNPGTRYRRWNLNLIVIDLPHKSVSCTRCILCTRSNQPRPYVDWALQSSSSTANGHAEPQGWALRPQHERERLVIQNGSVTGSWNVIPSVKEKSYLIQCQCHLSHLHFASSFVATAIPWKWAMG
jgi:hypothetical protein